MKKVIIFLKLHWLKILVAVIFLGVLIMASLFLYAAITNYFSLESFSRKQISAHMGLFLIIMIFSAFIQLPLFFGMHYFFMKGGGLGGVGAEKLDRASANIKWDEVIGMQDAKREAWELVQLLKDRSMVKMIGGKIIKGTLMVGPPGCGKTYLAKAIATECGLPMLATVGSEFVGILVGQGAMQMKALFKQARSIAQMEGGCIIFIDEIDSFARRRVGETSGSGISHNATINQFLTELDGLRQKENSIVVIAATNVSESELDEAIMRAGRFDRKIHVTKPNLEERQELFKFYLGRVNADKSINTEVLSKKCLGFSPSDIDSMIREAGLLAIRSKRDNITFEDLSKAYDRVIFGLQSNVVLSDKEKEWVAYHESGHAIIGYLLHPTDDVIKATIVPRKGYLGLVVPSPRQEAHIHDREWHLAQIKTFVASYAAERLKFGTTGNGVGGGPSSDFYIAMQYAHQMVWSYGMGKSGLIGDFSLWANQPASPFLAEKTKQQLNDDVQDILQTCLLEVTEVLQKNRELLDFFAQQLIEKGELEYDEIENIFGKFNLHPLHRAAKKNEA